MAIRADQRDHKGRCPRFLPGLARISHAVRCIGASNQRKLFLAERLFGFEKRRDPNADESVTRIRLNLHPSKDARWWRRSMAVASPRTPAHCFSARRMGRSNSSIVSHPASGMRVRRNSLEHAVRTLVGQRVFGIALGYEDLIDHDTLRHDPVMAVLAGKLFTAHRKDCAPVAGKSTLNRLELSRPDANALSQDQPRRAGDQTPVRRCVFVGASDARPSGSSSISTPPTTRCTVTRKAASSTAIMIATVICRSMCSAAGICWRRSCGQAREHRCAGRGGRGSGAHRRAAAPQRWPKLRILLRANSGFCRGGADGLVRGAAGRYLFGLARNDRLAAEIADNSRRLRARAEAERNTGASAHRQGLHLVDPRQLEPAAPRHRQSRVDQRGESQSALCRHLAQQHRKLNRAGISTRKSIAGAAGEMENRIKECQLDLFANRTSAHTMRANQLRLWFASMAYVLLCALRGIGFNRTEFADATCGSIRLKLLKIGALVHPSACGGSSSPWPRPVPTLVHSGQPTPCWRRLRADEPDSAQSTKPPSNAAPSAAPGDPCPPSPQAAVPPASAVAKASFSAPSTPTTTSGHPCCEKCGLGA